MDKVKKFYEKASIKIIDFAHVDVITTSGDEEYMDGKIDSGGSWDS